MGLFSWLKKHKVDSEYKPLSGADWYPAIYSQFGSDIYASDVVQQAINCIVREMKKLSPQHVIKKNKNYTESVNDEIQGVLDYPNDLMTTSDFIEKVVWQLYFNYNSFVLPIWEKGKLAGLYPLNPQQVNFLQDASGEVFVNMIFANGYNGTVRYADVIHIRYNYSVSEFMGGNLNGQPDNKALLKSLELNKTLLDGVAKAMNSSFAINGVVKYNTLIDGAKTEKALAELTAALKRNESGFMPLDLKADFIPFKREVKLVDEPTLKFIDEKILRHFGVPLAILTGDYNKTQYEAFYQKTLEPLIISMSQAFTKAIFSKRETFGFGHKIVFYHKELDFMTMDEKIRWMTMASSVGAITINEMRDILGYPPYDDEELGNTPIMSKNFGAADSVKDVDKNLNPNNNISNEGGDDGQGALPETIDIPNVGEAN